jgi:hypothetical protein
MNLNPTTKSFGVDDQSWLGSEHGTQSTQSITLDTSAFTEGTHYPDGYFKSGIPLSKIDPTDPDTLYGPYSGQANEVQTVTVTGSPTGGTFTLTFDGATTAGIAYNATAAAVKSALEALSTVNPGDVTVTGSAGGPYTITFTGRYVGDDVPALTASGASLTGGTSPGVTPATQTGGGGSTGALDGFLYCAVDAPTVNTQDVGAAILRHGFVRTARLPIAIDAAGKADVAGRITFI